MGESASTVFARIKLTARSSILAATINAIEAPISRTTEKRCAVERSDTATLVLPCWPDFINGLPPSLTQQMISLGMIVTHEAEYFVNQLSFCAAFMPKKPTAPPDLRIYILQRLALRN
jgi:hypothetical protein